MNEVDRLFAVGLELEKDFRKSTQAINTYLNVIEKDPTHAAAHINLGTLYYNRQDYKLAERHYRAAINIDPQYARAYFDLANVLDETGRTEEAIGLYKTALSLSPNYADTHYNIALAYEKIRQSETALKHWRAYVRIDPSSDWATHARNQIRRIAENSKIKLVYSNGQARKTGSAELFIV